MSGTSSRFLYKSRKRAVAKPLFVSAGTQVQALNARRPVPYRQFRRFIDSHTRATDVLTQLYNISLFELYKRELERPGAFERLKTAIKILDILLKDENNYGITLKSLKILISGAISGGITESATALQAEYVEKWIQNDLFSTPTGENS